MYAIRGLCHRRDMGMGHHGFSIDLAPAFQECVNRAGLNQAKIDSMIELCGREWLDCCGYDDIFDPDNCGFNRDEKEPPGPNAGPLYRPRHAIRVQYGEWGPEHISVPGNACGLDIERRRSITFGSGATLLPHNIDSLKQKYLLLIVFTEIAESVLLLGRQDRMATTA